jgi:hypothetical protein
MFAAFANCDPEAAKSLAGVSLTARIEREGGFLGWVKSYRGYALASVDGPPSLGPLGESGQRATLSATWRIKRGNEEIEESGEIKLTSPDGEVWFWADF